jgi:hypothetical protein
LTVVACSREAALPAVTAGASYAQVSALPDERRTAESARIAGELRHLDTKFDGWGTETVNDLAGKQLGRLGSLLHGASAEDLATARQMVTANFTCTELLAAQFEPALDSAAIEVSEGRISERNFAGPEGLLEALHELSGAFPAGDEVHMKSKIVYVAVGEPQELATRALIQLWTEGALARLQINAQWVITWSWPDQGAAPLMENITLERMDKNLAPQVLYSDCSEAVLGALPAWREQLLRGTDDWCARIDIAAGMSQYGHHGVSIADVDGDGLEDVYACQGGGLPNRLFKHLPDGSASDISAQAGVDWLDATTSSLLLDFDNDGDVDLFLALDSGLVVMSNDGGGRFEKSFELPLAGCYSLCAADFDGDELLDVYACRYQTAETAIGIPVPYHDANNGPPNALLRNLGKLKFADVTKECGLDENNRRFSFAAAWADYDEDGDMDLYVANDFGRNNLYRNEQGQFRDVAAAAGVEDISAGMGVSFGDFDGDGHLDLYVSNMFSSAGQRIAYQHRFLPGVSDSVRAQFERHARGNTLFRNRGDGSFEDVSEHSRSGMGRWAWGAQFCDVDNDGALDIFVPNGFITNEETQDL